MLHDYREKAFKEPMEDVPDNLWKAVELQEVFKMVERKVDGEEAAE